MERKYIRYKGELHFNYEFYYKIYKYSKSEIHNMIIQIEEQLKNCNDIDREKLQKEYDLLTERYDELV